VIPPAQRILLVLAAISWSGPSLDWTTRRDSLVMKPRPHVSDCLQVPMVQWPDTLRDANGKDVAALGPETRLLPPGVFPELQYLPDEGSVLLPAPKNRLRLLMAGPGDSYLLEGTGSLGDASWSGYTKVLSPGPKTEFDNGYAGTSGAWMDAKGTLWAFYHAEDQVGIPPMPGTEIPGYYASIGLATSIDTGRHWTKRGPLIRTRDPKIVGDSTRTDQGAAEPGVVASPDGKWLYVDWSDHSRPENEGVRICLSRMRIAGGTLLPASCRTWDGHGFNSPCLGGQAEPVLRGELVLGSRWNGDALEGHPVWVPRLKRYAMVFGVWPWKGLGDSSLVGTYLAFSSDMVHWERPVRILHDLSIPVPGRSLRWEAALLPDGTSNSTAWLVYGYSPHWPDSTGGSGHRPMLRRLKWLEGPVLEWTLPVKRPPLRPKASTRL